MATIPKTVARAIVKNDGHLTLEGNETADELRTALWYLLDHECDSPPGIPASRNLSKHYRIALEVAAKR